MFDKIQNNNFDLSLHHEEEYFIQQQQQQQQQQQPKSNYYFGLSQSNNNFQIPLILDPKNINAVGPCELMIESLAQVELPSPNDIEVSVSLLDELQSQKIKNGAMINLKNAETKATIRQDNERRRYLATFDNLYICPPSPHNNSYSLEFQLSISGSPQATLRSNSFAFLSARQGILFFSSLHLLSLS